jgi:hypothetical protein
MIIALAPSLSPTAYLSLSLLGPPQPPPRVECGSMQARSESLSERANNNFNSWFSAPRSGEEEMGTS